MSWGSGVKCECSDTNIASVFTLSTEAVFVSLRCGAQVGSRIKEGMRLRHFFMEGYHNFTVYFNNIIKTFLIRVLKYLYHIPHEEYYLVNFHKLTSMAKVTLDEHCGKTSMGGKLDDLSYNVTKMHF